MGQQHFQDMFPVRVHQTTRVVALPFLVQVHQKTRVDALQFPVQQGRIKRGHREHLPRAPLSPRGPPLLRKKNNNYYFK